MTETLMKIALDPYMQRHLSLPAIARATAELGYELLICLVQDSKAQKYTAYSIFKKPMNAGGKNRI